MQTEKRCEPLTKEILLHDIWTDRHVVREKVRTVGGFHCSSVQFQVLANMNAAYKHEKKRSAKRKMHNIPEMTYKITDPLFAAEDSPSPKKLKESLYLSFPVESMQGSANSIKTELTYHLAESGIHWERWRGTPQGWFSTKEPCFPWKLY